MRKGDRLLSCDTRIEGMTLATMATHYDHRGETKAMNACNLRSILLMMMCLMAASTPGEERPRSAAPASNPITMESQIRDVTAHGDDVMIHLIRQPYDIVAPVWLRVRTPDGRCMYARDLLKDDNVRIDGDLDHKTVSAIHITLQLRVEHR